MLALLATDRTVNLRWSVGMRKGLFRVADQGDGMLVHPNNHHVGPGSQLFMDHRLGYRWGNTLKRLFDPCKCPQEWGCSGRRMRVFTSLQSSTGGQLRLSSLGCPLCVPMVTKAARWGLKSQKQVQHKFKIDPFQSQDHERQNKYSWETSKIKKHLQTFWENHLQLALYSSQMFKDRRIAL